MNSAPLLERRVSTGHVFIYTKSVPTPKFLPTIKTPRFIIRGFQFLTSTIAFAALAVSAFNGAYPYSQLGTSGITFMVLTSISSMTVSLSCMFLYLFPALLGVPPQRYPRYSRIEVTVDLVYVSWWIAASCSTSGYGKCPPPTNPDVNNCLAWVLSFSFGFIASFLYVASFIIGVVDLHKHPLKLYGTKERGNWRDWGSDENVVDPTLSPLTH